MNTITRGTAKAFECTLTGIYMYISRRADFVHMPQSVQASYKFPGE